LGSLFFYVAKRCDDGYVPISITEEKTTRSIIVRGKEKDLDVVDKIIKEIDVRTKQVLIEAFIVEANSDFERALGTRLGGYYKRRGNLIGGVQGSSTGAAGIGSSTAALSSGTDSLTDFTAELCVNSQHDCTISGYARTKKCFMWFSSSVPQSCYATITPPAMPDIAGIARS
jgi:type II secretory pathway component GspD/PulD (secretin)